MKRILFLTGGILFIGLVFIFIYDTYIDKNKYQYDPINMSSYNVSGYYKIEPATILDAINQGEIDVFVPLQGDPFATEELPDIDISWSQADYLLIANALSQYVWGESLDFKNWKIYSIQFSMRCQDAGFYYGEITYFNPYHSSWHRMYSTRHIEIDPLFGIVRWGYNETYPQPILFYKWNNLDLLASKISADDAMKIANANGGETARRKVDNDCYVNLRAPVSFKSNNDHWGIDIISNRLVFEIYIDPYTGQIVSRE
jgi:hypothetical protein